MFAGERVRVVSLPADVPVTLAEFTRLLEAGGAVVLNDTRLPASERDRSSASPPRASRDQDQVPESQPGETGGGEGETGAGGRVESERGGAGRDPPTATVASSVGELSDDDAGAGRGVAVDWHWVFHSIVHHRALDKEPYRRALLDAGGKGRG